MSSALPSVKIPRLNPIRLYNYLTELPFTAGLSRPIEYAQYEQIFSRFDTLAFEIWAENSNSWDVSNVITCKVYDINEELAATFTVNNKYAAGAGIDGYYVYEVREVLTSLTAGVYQIRVNVKNYNIAVGPPYTLLNEYNYYSEPIYLEDQFTNSVIFKYGHENNLLGLLTVDPDTYSVSGTTTPAAANQEYTNIGTYNSESKYRSVDLAYLMFYSTTLQGGSVWVVQANATTTPDEAAANYAYNATQRGGYTNVGTWAGVTVVDYAMNYFYHRVFGGFDTNDFQPGSNDVVYRDQPYNITQLNSIPLTTTKLTIGGARGVPNWQIDIINRILSCSYMNISGRKLIKNDGAKLEKTLEKSWPLMGWKIELADEENVSANEYNGYDYNGDYYNDYLINL